MATANAIVYMVAIGTIQPIECLDTNKSQTVSVLAEKTVSFVEANPPPQPPPPSVKDRPVAFLRFALPRINLHQNVSFSQKL